MKFSFEVPTKYLHELDNNLDYLFIIGHHLLDDKKYFNYCKNNKKYKILDNGAYELTKSIEPKILKELAEKIKADVIVLPDILFDSVGSEKLQKEFFNLFSKTERNKYKFLKVVSANSLDLYLKNLIKINLNNNIDIIGISKSRTMITPNLTFIMNYLKNKCSKIKPIHLLGCSHPFELIEASYFKEIKSIDTGLPINFAFKNKKFPNIKKAEDFNRISGEDLNIEKKLNVKLAKENIKKFRSYYKKCN